MATMVIIILLLMVGVLGPIIIPQSGHHLPQLMWTTTPSTTKNNAPDEHADALYEITSFMDTFFQKHEIAYWLICGSLIGALRNTPPGPIKWDDDIDVAIFKSDQTKLRLAMETDPEFVSTIDFVPAGFGFQLRLKSQTSETKDYYYDIFVYEYRDGIYGKKWYTNVFPEHYYDNIHEIVPTRLCKFWDLYLPGPNSLETARRGYAEDVLTFAKKYNHREPLSHDDDAVNVHDHVNDGDTIPMLSKNLIRKLTFREDS
jgi:LicD family